MSRATRIQRLERRAARRHEDAATARLAVLSDEALARAIAIGRRGLSDGIETLSDAERAEFATAASLLLGEEVRF